MTEKDYLLLEQMQSKRVICGFKQDFYGNVVITTGIPKQYKEGQIIYEDQETVSYEDYITSQFQQSNKRQKLYRKK